ncbi:YdcF family protein [Acetobacter sp. AN02]|uniref:YdcF family protein n=1 Tax=Acetobacter sp. AN02 TaxID=2894186 RepID=UPI002434204A|nr:YdcF family protein [Acetobacter sp. AN02]MDG6094091.1 YdcF family protein [Acetobacter sp. AN02]
MTAAGGLPVIVFGAALRPDGQPSDIMQARVAAAVRFASCIPGSWFLVTGGAARNGVTESQAMHRLLTDAGIFLNCITEETRAEDTYQSVRLCSDILKQEGYGGEIAVVTSDFHLFRCCLLMRLAGWRVIPVSAPSGPLLSWRGLRLRLHEFPATLWDAILVVLWRLRHKHRN